MNLFRSHFINLFCCLFLYVNCIKGSQLDSLKKVSLNQKDSTLVDTYIQLARYYFQKDHVPDSMIKYAQLATKTSINNKLTNRILKSQKALGLAYTEAMKVDLAKAAYDEAMSIAKQTNNVEEIIGINNKLGYLYGKVNDLEKSAFYYLNTAKEYEKLKDYRNLALTYKNVVVIFTLQEQYDKIMFYTNKALALIPYLKEKEDADIRVDVYSSTAQHYFLIGDKKPDSLLINKAILYADTCLSIGLKYNINYGMADAYYILSYGYSNKKDYTNTLLFAKKALAYKGTIPDRTVFNIYSSITKTYLEMGDNKLSALYLDSCKLQPASKELDAPTIIYEIEHILYKRTGKYKESLMALENLMKFKQEILNKDRNQTINDLEIKYQTELKEAKISELNQQKEIDALRLKSLIGIVVAIVFVLIAVVFFYRQSVIKSKLQKMETEQRLNRARMNPHFFFNVLASIQTMILEEQDAGKSALMISKFSKIMRQSLESTYNELVSIEEEKEFISNYLDIQKMRYDNKFNYEIEIANEIDTDTLQVPSMLIQPFIENSIEHGFKDINHKGLLTIKFEVENSQLKVSCTDNGKGFRPSEKHKGYPSRATQIIKDRLSLLNEQYKPNSHFDINTDENIGTSVVIHLPIFNNN